MSVYALVMIFCLLRIQMHLLRHLLLKTEFLDIILQLHYIQLTTKENLVYRNFDMENSTSIRKKLHSIAEPSGKEIKTAAYIKSVLQVLKNFTIVDGFAMQSVLAVFDSGTLGPCLLFRCELDGIPLTESLPIPYASIHKGTSHKCGHDGHMTILLAFAKKLSTQGLTKGKVLLLFQSAEETGMGAQAICNSGILKKYSPDFVFAFHNLPGYSTEEIICSTGTFSASVSSIKIQLKGKESHASQPMKGINPALAISDLILYFQSYQTSERKKNTFFLSTPIFIEMGNEAYGTSAGNASIGYTFRSWNDQLLQKNIAHIQHYLHSLEQKYPGLKTNFSFLERFHSTENHHEAVLKIQQAATKCHLKYVENKLPFEWGEDFGVFTDQYKGAMFCVGSGIMHPPLHTAAYDFPDVLINRVAKMLMYLAQH